MNPNKIERKLNNPEISQEEFDVLLEKVLNKLNINLTQFKEEIEKRGGVEKFKEYYEEKLKSGGNRAGNNIDDLSVESDELNKEANIKAILSGVYFSAIVILGVFNSQTGGFKFNEQLEVAQNAFAEKTMSEMVAVVISSLLVSGFAGMGSYSLIDAFKGWAEAKKVKLQELKERLKFKMTGTNIESRDKEIIEGV